MGNFLAELKRRNVYRAGAAYAVVAWVLLQVAANLSPILDLPPWIARSVVFLLVIGFPVALVFAWMQQLAPESGARAANGKLDWFLAGALVIVIVFASYQQLALMSGTAPATREAGVEAAREAAASPSTAISIAVLPFTNLSSDPEQEFFSDGMTEEITSALAKITDLRVVARTSAFQFKGQNQDMQAIGLALRATHLIEGSVRKAGTRLRITAQLIEADDGTHLWTENYDRELTDVFAIQEDIATAIAVALRVPLGLRQGDTLVRDRTQDLDSYDQYLRARALVRAQGIKPITDAIALLEQVVARDPGFAPGWATLAYAYVRLPGYGLAVRSSPIEETRRVAQSALDKADMAVRESIRLDSRNAYGYGVLANVHHRRGNWEAAEDFFKQALALDPNQPDTLEAYGTMLSSLGRLRDSLSIRERLRSLEPLSPLHNIITASIMQAGGQSQATIPILEGIPQEAGGGYFRNAFLARAYAAAGRYGEAADLLLAMNAQNQVSRRSLEDAARLLRGAPTKTATPQALPILEGELSFVYAYAGALDRTLEFPERQLEIRYFVATGASLWLPEIAPVRKTERFKAFARAAKFVEYWRARGWPEFCRPQGAEDFVCA